MVIPFGIFGPIFIFMPFGLFGSAYAYYRLPAAVMFIALASSGWGKKSPAQINLVCLLLAACLIIRVVSVFSDWQPAQSVIGEYDTALQSIPPGSRLMVVVRLRSGATVSLRSGMCRCLPLLSRAFSILAPLRMHSSS